MKTKSLRVAMMLTAALFLTLQVAQGDMQARQAPNPVTKIKVNGLSADMFLVDADAGANGFLNASRDQIANTSALDFSCVVPLPDPDFVIFIQGAGAIPNGSFQITATSARLRVTTPFPVNRCIANLVDGTFTCAETTPSTLRLDVGEQRHRQSV
jgi:hypothetical protein